MNALKELYEHYTISEEYAALGTIPEMETAFKEIEDWAKQLSKEDCGKLEELVNTHTATVELQGFVYGFRYGVQIMSECMPKGGVQ